MHFIGALSYSTAAYRIDTTDEQLHNSALSRMAKLTESELDRHLKDLVNWERFALHLPKMKQPDICLIKKNETDVTLQRLALYEKWLKVYPDASWKDVVQALETIEENTIARDLKKALISVRPQARLGNVKVSRDIVEELKSLETTFVSITEDVKSKVENVVVNDRLSVPRLVSRTLEERAYHIPELYSVNTHFDYFTAIQPHYSFLNCHLIIRLAVFLSQYILKHEKEFEEKVLKPAKDYDKRVESFKDTTQVIDLRNHLDQFIPNLVSDASLHVIIMIEKSWGQYNIWLVEELVRSLFGLTSHNECQWFRVRPGSLIVSFLVPKYLMMLLIVNSVKKLHFMRLMGVISLQVGRIYVLKDMGGTSFSFQNSLIRATISNDFQVVQFLIQVMLIDVNTQLKGNNATAGNDVFEIYHITERFKKVQNSFVTLRQQVEELLINTKNLTLARMVEYIIESMPHFDEILRSVVSTPSLIEVVRPHYNFLNPKMIVNLAHLSSNLAQQAKVLSNDINTLKSITQVAYLQYPLNQYIETFKSSVSIKVAVVLSNVWRSCSVSVVEMLIEKVFSLKYFDYFQWFRVVFGSLLVVLLAPKHMKGLLVKESKENKQLLKLMGVISVKVGSDFTMREKDDEYTFNKGIAQAKLIKNDVLVQFLSMAKENALANVNLSIDSNQNYVIKPDPDSTALMIACCNNNLSLVKFLLDNNANPNIKTKRNFTALMYACIVGNSKIVQLLLNCNANIDEVNVQMDTAMHIACNCDNAKVVETLLSKPLKIDMKDENSQTPLCIASRKGQLHIVQRLLRAKADPKIRDKYGQIALRIASDRAYSQVVEKLLEVQVDPPDEVDENGVAALHVATSQGHSLIVKQLLRAKANPDIQDPYGTTALYSASENGYLHIVKILLDAHANPNIRCNDGATPLFRASWNSHSEIVEALLAARADPNIQDHLGRTALYIASYEGLSKIAALLLKANANPNIPKHNGATPLYIACQECYLEIATMLLKAKADPNIQTTDDGTTALHMAVAYGNIKLVQLLLKFGADASIVDFRGLSTLAIARLYNKNDIVKVLQRAL